MNAKPPLNATALAADSKIPARMGITIAGFPRRCHHCEQRAAYHSHAANWQNRVACLNCGKKWSE